MVAEKWSIKREVSIPDIISFLSAVVAVLFAYTTLDKRVSLVEAAVIAQSAVDQRQDTENLRAKAAIESQLDKMNAKLDRLIENQMRR